MICQWCKQPVSFDNVGKRCPGITGEHRPDNRHTPSGEPCICGRPGIKHRVGHAPKGDPCSSCHLPAECHITQRKSVNTPKNRAALWKRDGWKCMLCQKDFDDPPPSFPDPMSVQVDHIVQVWKDGPDTIDNLRLAHRYCNMKRQEEELSPAQLLRNERAKARWAAIVGEKDAATLDTALHGGGPEGRATALGIMLAGLEAKKAGK